MNNANARTSNIPTQDHDEDCLCLECYEAETLTRQRDDEDIDLDRCSDDASRQIHRRGCECRTCRKRSELANEIRSIEQALDLIKEGYDLSLKIHELRVLRASIQRDSDLDGYYDRISESIQRLQETLAWQERKAMTPTEDPLYVKTGDPEWIRGLFVDEEPTGDSNDVCWLIYTDEGRRWFYSVADISVNEVRGSTEAAEKILCQSEVEVDICPIYRLQRLVWILNAYRLTVVQFERICDDIKEVREEIRSSAEWEVFYTERNSEQEESILFIDTYATHETLVVRALRERNTKAVQRSRRRDIAEIRKANRGLKGRAIRKPKQRGQKRREPLPAMMRTT
jgi:hypothetical protein